MPTAAIVTIGIVLIVLGIALAVFMESELYGYPRRCRHHRFLFALAAMVPKVICVFLFAGLWILTTCAPTDSILTHEVGHFMGLGHETVQSIMQPYVDDGRAPCLYPDDLAGIAFLYKQWAKPVPAGQPLSCMSESVGLSLVPVVLVSVVMGTALTLLVALIHWALIHHGCCCTIDDRPDVGRRRRQRAPRAAAAGRSKRRRTPKRARASV